MASRSRSESRWRLSHSRAGLIRPASAVERGRPERLGRGRLLQDLELGDGLAVRGAVRRVLRRGVGGRCAAKRLDDVATTSIAARLGLASGGELPPVRLGQAMAHPPVPRVSACHPSEFWTHLPTLSRCVNRYKMCISDVGLWPVSSPSCPVVVASRWIGWIALATAQPDGAHLGGAVASAGCSALADDRHCRSTRACEARPARSTLPRRSRRARRRRPHRKGPPMAQRAAQTDASASPSPSENSVCCHCPAPDSSDGNTKPRSVPAQATSALDRASSSAT